MCSDIEEFTKLKVENTELKAENEKLIEGLGIANKYVNKYHQTLQKIKKYIAKICKEECGYVQKKRCPDCDCRYGAILDLTNKVEEE